MNNDMEINDYSEMQRGKTFAKNTSAKKTKKSHKKSKNVKSIPRKTMSVVEKDLKAEYQKYLNAINRRKLCKKKTFRQFVDGKIGKKSRRKGKKTTTAAASADATAEPEVAASVEETPSVEPDVAAASVEETPSVEPEVAAASVEETPSVEATQEESTSTSPEEESNEEKPKGLFDTITSALSPTEKPKEEEPNKTGGKRRKGCKGKGKGSRRSK